MSESTANNGKLKFVLKKVEIPIEIDYEDGTTHHFILKKANGTAVKEFRKVTMRGAKIQGNAIVGLGNSAEAEHVLIAQCLREVTFDGEGKRTGDRPVSADVISSWEYPVIRGILEKLQEISDMKDIIGNSNNPKERLAEIEKEKLELEQMLAEEEQRKN